MASSLDKLASNLCDASGIQWGTCKSNMELIDISDDYIASFRRGRCKKKDKGSRRRAVKKEF